MMCVDWLALGKGLRGYKLIWWRRAVFVLPSKLYPGRGFQGREFGTRLSLCFRPHLVVDAGVNEVDILGYASNQSDTDDHSSIQSSASDGGVTISTRRLTITEPPSDAL
ncbi:putative max dimerization protein 1-like [Homarus americanus]|uniref:Putative max dimerization protein 1-like n=1 Tax=Homarus americanus TaxID=6706 RepID=A0A8J5N8J1_HOMAM|nr:putative max dimerization protein 1-like [Homarus americanus]